MHKILTMTTYQKAKIVAITIDVLVDLSLKMAGIIYFFFRQEYQLGAMMFAASGVYSISMYCGHLIRKENEK